MAQQTPGQARVIDPILTEIVRGYVQAELVGRKLFPIVPVAAYGGQVIEFGKEAFRLYNPARAPGAATKRLQFGYAGKPYAIVPKAIEAVVPRELATDAAAVPQIDLATRSINTVMRVMNLDHEYNCAQIARNPANYDADHKVALAGGALWSAAGSDPVADIEAGREAIRETIGVYPNVLLLSAKALKALKSNAAILDRIKYTQRGLVTTDILASLFEIPNVVIGAATVATGQNDVLSDVWGTDAVMAYSNVGGSPNPEEPGYGY